MNETGSSMMDNLDPEMQTELIEQLLAAAARKFMVDPEHHAVVTMTFQVIATAYESAFGRRMTDEERTVIKQAASLALEISQAGILHPS